MAAGELCHGLSPAPVRMRIRLCRNSRLKERRTDVDCIKVNIMDLIPVVLLLLFLGLTLAGGVLVAWL